MEVLSYGIMISAHVSVPRKLGTNTKSAWKEEFSVIPFHYLTAVIHLNNLVQKLLSGDTQTDKVNCFNKI
jgi:hypothetical protein